MDLEDNETAMNSFDSQVKELKGTVESLEAQLAHTLTQMSDVEARLEDSKAQVEPPEISFQTSILAEIHELVNCPMLPRLFILTCCNRHHSRFCHFVRSLSWKPV